MDIYKIHITYNNNLSFSEFNKICDSLNKAFNDINRENGLKSTKQIKEHNAIITNFDKGSVILELVASFVVSVASGLVVSAIKSRLSKIKENKIDVEIVNDEKGKFEIHIHIENWPYKKFYTEIIPVP